MLCVSCVSHSTLREHASLNYKDCENILYILRNKSSNGGISPVRYITITHNAKENEMK